MSKPKTAAKPTARFKNENRDRPSLKVTLPRDLLEELERVAGLTGRSALVEKALRYYLATMGPKKK